MPQTKSSPARPDGGNKKNDDSKGRFAQYAVSYLLTSLFMLWLFQMFVVGPSSKSSEISYSEFKNKVSAGQIVDVTIGERVLVGKMKDPKGGTSEVPFNTVFMAGSDPHLADDLKSANVKYQFQRPPNPIGAILLQYVFPLVILGFFWSAAYKRMGGEAGMGGIFGVGKSKATQVKPEDITITYKDVGGADEAITDMQEIIHYLKAPERFTTLGGRIPKGVLLVGPPGTGKTLLAKATAGEAHVPFFETSGSEFVEMFVGVGAARVRDLFETARKVAPAIVFIDEIDAIGQSRGGVMRMGANDEREQTLNQLLAEIDGFKTEAGAPVIIMAATNRPEVLDPALLRAGRFDRQIAIGNPDLNGRIQILQIHSKNIKLSSNFDMERAARMTAGFSGADLANAMNEAALMAAREKAPAVTLADFETAIERVIAGSEKKSRVMNPQERTTVAYHESGHALVAELVNGEPVAKISIVPHSRGALGYTMQTTTEDRYLLTAEELQDKLAVMLGGRAAELLTFHKISTGASDDIMRATELARRMVVEFGMSPQLGSVRYAGQQMQYMGQAVEDDGHLSPETRKLIDGEVHRIVTEQYDRAQKLLTANQPALKSLAAELLEHETVDGTAVKNALAAQASAKPSSEGAPLALVANG